MLATRRGHSAKVLTDLYKDLEIVEMSRRLPISRCCVFGLSEVSHVTLANLPPAGLSAMDTISHRIEDLGTRLWIKAGMQNAVRWNQTLFTSIALIQIHRIAFVLDQ